MKDNPYSAILEAIGPGSQNLTSSVQLAVVVEQMPNLVIQLGDLQIDKDNIFIADYLLSGHKRKVSIPTAETGGETSFVDSHNHKIESISIDDTEITFIDDLKKGDNLAVFPTSDKQTYIILSRVVSL